MFNYGSSCKPFGESQVHFVLFSLTIVTKMGHY